MKTDRGVTVLSEKEQKPKTPIEHLFYDGLIENSFPFNWLIYYKFKNRGYKDKDSFNAALLLGYYVSWQSTYTKNRKLQKGGYSYRSREYIKYDIGFNRDAYKRARDILEQEKLISVKPMPGQSVYYKIKVNDTLKYLHRAKKEYATRIKNNVIPGHKTTTSNDLEITIDSNKKGKGLEPNNQVKAITFNDYKNLYIPDTDDPCEEEYYNNAIAAIEYFINKHEKKFPPSKHPGTWTKTLKPGTWENQIDTLFSIYDEGYDRHLDGLDIESIKEFMDIYFNKDTYRNCDYSIVHFNDPKIKEILYYEWQRG